MNLIKCCNDVVFLLAVVDMIREDFFFINFFICEFDLINHSNSDKI
jgi:hypothetical protein